MIIYIVSLFLNWLSNLEFWRRKKVVQVVQIGGRGGEVFWTKSKRTAFFFHRRPSLSLNDKLQDSDSPIFVSLTLHFWQKRLWPHVPLVWEGWRAGKGNLRLCSCLFLFYILKDLNPRIRYGNRWMPMGTLGVICHRHIATISVILIFQLIASRESLRYWIYSNMN